MWISLFSKIDLRDVVFLLLFSFVTILESSAQKSRPGTPITCHTSGIEVDSKHYVLAPKSFYSKNTLRTAAGESSFELFLSGFPPESEEAMNWAMDIWGQFIKSDMPIKVTANWVPLGTGGTLATASPTEEIRDFDGAPQPEMYYPIALAEKISRQELNSPSASEIGINVNSDRDDWYFGIDGNPGAGEIDLVTVILHELGHGLGFTANNGTNCFADPTIYAYFIHDGTSQQLVDESIFPGSACNVGGSEAIRAAFTSNNLFFKRPGELNISQLYAPNPFRGGSSISHLDETTYDQGDPNQLMTPNIDGVIHDPGPLTLQMFAEMGWVYTYLDHSAFTDVEIFNLPFTVLITSDTTLITDQILLHYSSDDFQTEATAILTPTATPDEYSVTIPDPGTDITLSYYFTAVDELGRTFSLPHESPAEVFSFFIGADQVAPTISHNPITLVLTSSASVDLKASLTDNIGIASGQIEYRINQGSLETVSLQPDSEIENQFVGSIQLPQTNKGDILEYRIVATDASSSANQTTAPESGFFSVEIQEFDPVASYFNDFNEASADFVGDDYTVSLEVGFVDDAIHSPHPYPVGVGTSMESNLVYQLAIPITVASEEAEIKFDEVVLVEPGEDGSSFGEDAFNDYVIVEGSDDNGVTWLPLLDGYDATAEPEWLDKYNSIIKGVNSEAIGNRLIFKQRVINMLETFSAEESILIRFRLFTNAVSYGWGWAIDNLEIQNQVVSIEGSPFTKQGLKIYPNPSTGTVNLEFSQHLSSAASIEVYNAMGSLIYVLDVAPNEGDVKLSFDLGDEGPGLYVVRAVFEKVGVTQKVLIK